MDSDGRHQRRLRTPHDEWQAGGPTWTPDGRMIFFVRTDWSDGVSSLFLINGDGTRLTRLARSRSLNGVAWSPTGRTLAVDHSDPSAPIGSGDELTIADLRRGGGGLVLRPVKTIRNVWPGAFLWAPDGRTIIYENDAGTWVVDARRPEPRRRFPVQVYLDNLGWSPDRRWLAFSRSRVLAKDPIEVATAAGRERRTVTRKICCLLDELAWAPR